MRKFLLPTLLLGLAVFITACAQTNTLDPNLLTTQNTGKIAAVSELSHDWQDINIMGGKVSQEFQLKNEGAQALVLKGAVTTCMCTEATFTLPDGTKSPVFGMHQNPTWAYSIKPGEEFSINIVFDPMAHGPNGVGFIQRGVYITSSSVESEIAKKDHKTGDSVTQLTVQGNVLSKADYEKKTENLGFKFDKQEHDFGVIKQSGGIVTANFDFEYLGAEKITVTGTPTSCACTSASISSKNLNPGDKGTLTVEFDPNLHAEPEGKFFKTVSILTDPKLESQPELKIWVEIDLDLGPEAFKLKDDNHDDESKSSYSNIKPAEFKTALANKDFFLLDVHIPEQDHIEKTDAFIPYTEIKANLNELPKDKSAKIVVYCRSGSMSLEAAQTLIELGYNNVINLEGGRDAYMKYINQ